MGALDGSINTPFGSIQKKTALILGGGAVLIIGIVWWRTNNTDEKPDIYDAEINPATGYPYGSAEDAAALAQQAQYVSPPTGGGSGGGGYPPGGIGFTNNAQWTQAVIDYMTTAGLVEDPAALSAALGAYISGSPIQSGQRTLIEQAIAAQGFPPLAGPNGYPPAINTASTPPPPPSTTPPPTSGSPPPVGTKISAKIDYDLYKWSREIASGYHMPTFTFHTLAALNPWIYGGDANGKYIVWYGNVSPKTPKFRKSGGIPRLRIR